MGIVPLLWGLSALVKGLSGMGEAIVFGAGWQLFYLFGFEEMDNLGFLAGLVCIMQCWSTALLALKNRHEWWRYRKPGGVFSVSMTLLSPVGNYVREVVPTNTIRLFLAVTFIAFSLLKVLSDGVKEWMRKPAVASPPRSSVTSAAASDDDGFAEQTIGACTSETDHPDGAYTSDTDHPDGEPRVPSSQPIVFIHAEEPLVENENCKDIQMEEPELISLDGPFVDPLKPDALQGLPDVRSPPARSLSSFSSVSRTSTGRPFPVEPGWLLMVLPPVGLIGGFLGGLCGMNGPPFILLVAFTGLDKVIARNVFPMGQLFEVWCLRLPILIVSGRIALVDVHLYVVGLVAGIIGLSLGNYLSEWVSQLAFERAILTFLVLSSLMVLGILSGHPRSLVALGIVVFVLSVRMLCVWVNRRKVKREEMREI